MKKTLVAFFTLLWTGVSFAQSPILLDIAGDKVTLEDFNLVYNKNNKSAQAIDPKSKEEYLEMFIDFKLKVREAEELGMDTAAAFKRELSGYRAQLAAPYLTDQKVTEDLIKEAYDRKQYDVNAYHILIPAGLDASPKDTFDAYIECQRIKREIKDPAAQFEEMARKFSKDPSVSSNGGNLGYFNVFQMVYPFESAAYNTPVGTISDPVRTRFGYHILWVKDKRPARGEIKVAHIMVKGSPSDDAETAARKKQKIDEIFVKLESGEDFAALARRYSEDEGSAPKGGALAPFGTGRMVQSFEDAAFSLNSDGDYSAPVQTAYGWHIIQRIEKIDLPPYEEVKAELKTKVTRDGRGTKSKESFYQRTLKEYRYKVNKKALLEVASWIDASYAVSQWKGMDKVGETPATLFSFRDKKYIKETKSWTQKDLVEYLLKDHRYQRRPLVDSVVIVNAVLESFVNSEITKFENDRLEAKYPKFRALMQEYHDGILLFDLMDQKVWSKAIKDSAAIAEYYEAHKGEYMWDERAHSVLISAASQDVAQRALDMIKKQPDTSINLEEIMTVLNDSSQLAVNLFKGKYSKGDDEKVDQYGWKKGGSEIFESDGRYWVVYTLEMLPPDHKKLDETRGIVVSGLQEQLEKEWLEELRKKYPVEVFREVLK